MKKIYLYAILATFASMSMLTSCDADAEFETEVPVNPVMRPIISLTAMEQEDIFEGVIDDNKRTIKLEVEAWTDLSNMTVNLNIPKRATLISPSSPEGVWDLTQPVNVVINNIERDVTYTVTAKKKAEFIENPIVSLVAKAGGETATGEIDHTNHTIKLNFGPWVNLSETTLTIEVKPHVKLVDPITLETVCNFSETKTKSIIVNDVQKDVTCNLVVTQTELEAVEVARENLKEYKLDNDANPLTGDLPGAFGDRTTAKLFDGKFMSAANQWGEVGWSAGSCGFQPNNNPDGSAWITVNVGKIIYLAKFSAHRYRSEELTHVTNFDIFGYCQEGQPAQDGNWDGWIKLGTFKYNPDTHINFAEGDCINIDKNSTKQAQYYRIVARENWFGYTHTPEWREHVYTFTEFQFWEYK